MTVSLVSPQGVHAMLWDVLLLQWGSRLDVGLACVHLGRLERWLVELASHPEVAHLYGWRSSLPRSGEWLDTCAVAAAAVRAYAEGLLAASCWDPKPTLGKVPHDPQDLADAVRMGLDDPYGEEV